MIGLEGGYVASFSVGTYTDFVRDADLHLFKLIEEAGNILPIAELEFTLRDASISKYLTEKATIMVSIGRDKDQMVTTSLVITKRDKSRASLQSQSVRLLLALDKTGYMLNCSTSCIPGSSLSVISSVVKKYFKVETNITATSDSMSWIQHNISDRNFVNNIWLHSLPKNDLMMVGITSQAKFRIRGLAKLLSRDPEWVFSSTTVKESDKNKVIRYKPNAISWSDSALLNSLGGYSKSRIVHNLDDNSSSYQTPNNGSMMAISSHQEQNSDVGRRVSSVSVHTDGIYDRYHQSYDANVKRLLQLQIQKVKLQVDDRYIPVQVLDSVLFIDDMDINRAAATEDTSGRYIVSKVARVIKNRKFYTIITLCRDGMNGVTSA